MMNPTTILSWYKRTAGTWIATTAKPTEREATAIRRMGYAVRIGAAVPTGEPTREDWIAVFEAGGSWWGEGLAPARNT